MAEVNLQEIHDTLVSIAFEAGRMIVAANTSDITTGTKLNCTLRVLHKFYPFYSPAPPVGEVIVLPVTASTCT